MEVFLKSCKNTLKGAQNAARRKNARGPACVCGRGHFGKIQVSVFSEKWKFRFLGIHWAPVAQLWYVVQMSRLIFGRKASRIACRGDCKGCVVRFVTHALPYTFRSKTEDIFWTKITKISEYVIFVHKQRKSGRRGQVVKPMNTDLHADAWK